MRPNEGFQLWKKKSQIFFQVFWISLNFLVPGIIEAAVKTSEYFQPENKHYFRHSDMDKTNTLDILTWTKSSVHLKLMNMSPSALCPTLWKYINSISWWYMHIWLVWKDSLGAHSLTQPLIKAPEDESTYKVRWLFTKTRRLNLSLISKT